MARTTYKKKIKNGKEYYFYRLRHENLKKPKDIYGKSVKELELKIKNETKKLDNNIIDNNQFFSVFLENWLFDIRFEDPNLKSTSKEKYEGLYRNYIKNSYLANIKLKDIKLDDVNKFYSQLRNNGVSNNCILNINKIVAPCVSYAYNNNFIIKDFSKLIKKSKKTLNDKNNKVVPFTKEEQIIFTTNIKGHPLEMLFITALNTGMRLGELLALTWEDVNLETKHININKTVRNTPDVSRNGRANLRMQIQTPKSQKSIRRIPIPNNLAINLKHYKDNQYIYILKSNECENLNLVFPNSYGRYLDSSNISKQLKKIITAINQSNPNFNIKHHKFHDFRHTFATRLFELGVSPKTVQELLGHSNSAITLDIYTHVLKEVKYDAITKLDDLYKTMNINSLL